MPQQHPHENCPRCGSLGDREEAFFKNGSEQYDTPLPPAAGDLILVQDHTGVSSRAKQLKQCPECETYYWFWTDYEFLAGGSEDEQFLIRLRPEQVSQYFKPPPEGHLESNETAELTSEANRESSPVPEVHHDDV